MATFEQPETLAERVARQGIQPLSDSTPLEHSQRVSQFMQGEPSNVAYWEEKRNKQAARKDAA